MEIPFNKKLELEWISVDDRMPLYEIDREKWPEVIGDFFVLIQDDSDSNDDVHMVQIAYTISKNGDGWCWADDGSEYHKCHAKNIKYWCAVPVYERF